MTLLGLDISNHQGNVDLAAARAAGRDFVVIKATQGVSFADPYLAVNRAKAHAAGMIVGLYQFADLDDAVADARWFLSHVGPLQPNEFLVLDEEVQQPNKVAWCTTWLQTVHAATGTWPLIYMNRSTAAGYNWGPVAANSGLWLAQYDNSTTQPSIAGWPAVAMKQYSDKGSVLGVAGTCDVDVFYGSTAQLLAYCTPSGGTNDMTPDQANQLQALYDAMFKGGSSMPGGLPLPQSTAYAVWQTTISRAGKNVPALQELADAKTAALDIDTKVGTAAPQVDAQALANALIADTGAISTLADALAAAIAKRLGNG